MNERKCWCLIAGLGLVFLATGVAGADDFGNYTFAGSFALPAAGVYDVFPDGRLVTLDGADVYTETAVGSRSFTLLGTLPDADMPDPAWSGPAFVSVSPDGGCIAVGNNGGFNWNNYQVGVFSISDLDGDWFAADHYEAEWVDDANLALTAGTSSSTGVTILDTTTDPTNPVNTTVITNIGGASAGLAFDTNGNLFTGNGFQFGGPSDTGWIRAFPSTAWQAALAGGPTIDFETDGTLIADLLAAGTLGFDTEGNLHVGGGDLYGGSGDYNYAGLVCSTALADALGGGGAVNPLDPSQVRRFDPDPGASSVYDVNCNTVTGELYLRLGGTVYAYAVPEPGSLALLILGTLVCSIRR